MMGESRDAASALDRVRRAPALTSAETTARLWSANSAEQKDISWIKDGLIDFSTHRAILRHYNIPELLQQIVAGAESNRAEEALSDFVITQLSKSARLTARIIEIYDNGRYCNSGTWVHEPWPAQVPWTDPSWLLEALSSATGATLVGHETVQEVATDHIRVSVDPHASGLSTHPLFRSGPIRLAIWLDSDDRIRRMRWRPLDPGVEETIEFFDFGVETNIELPDPATVRCRTRTCPLHGRPADEDLRPPSASEAASGEQVMARVRAAVERTTDERSARVCTSRGADDASIMTQAAFMGTTNFLTGRTLMRPSIADLEEEVRNKPRSGLGSWAFSRIFTMASPASPIIVDRDGSYQQLVPKFWTHSYDPGYADPTAPQWFFGQLDRVVDATVVGEQPVRETLAERIRLTIDPPATGRIKDQPKTGQPLQAHLWLDEDGRIRRLSIGQRENAAGSEPRWQIIELWDFGVPADIETPRRLVGCSHERCPVHGRGAGDQG